MPSPDYLPLALGLPAVYQDDQDSFAQLDSYLDLADTLLRSGLTALDDVETWLTPESLDHWPSALPADAGEDAVLEAQQTVQDELASWTGFTFPPSWPQGAAGLRRRRAYLRRAVRLWRERGTPRGFVNWFCLAFADATGAKAPDLVEHFRVADPVAADVSDLDPWLRATLFVRGDRRFADYGRRREAIAFVDRYAPAHVSVRVCWVGRAFTLPALPPSPTKTQVQSWQHDMRDLLCSVVSEVDHGLGIRIWSCADEGRAQDRLDVGAIPEDHTP